MPSWSEILVYIKDQLSTNQFFSAAAFASILTAVLMSLKGVPKSIWDRIVRLTTYKATVYQTEDLYYHLTQWFNETHRAKVRNVEYSSGQHGDEDPPPLNRPEEYSAEDPNGRNNLIETPVDDYFYKWIGWRLVRISYGKEKLENASSLKSVYLKNYTFKGLFASKAIRDLMNKVNDEYSKRAKIQYVYQSEHHYFQRISKIGGKKMSEVILNEDIKSKIIKDIEEWRASREDYARKGIPYKRGHCYYGPPGTGKTTIVKALAKEYGFNIYNLNLKKTEDDDLLYLLRDIEPGSILLFEDIDSTFDKRKRIGTKGVTFSGFLNALDGVVELNGVLIIITTNHVEKMDPALLRAGRMDLKIEIGYSSEEEISDYLSRFYGEKIEIFTRGLLPMVEVQNICLENKLNSGEAVKTIDELLKNNVYS